MISEKAGRFLGDVGRAGFVVFASALAAAAVRSLFVNPDLVMWRAAALAMGLGLGAWRLEAGILAFVFLTPLLGMLPRSLGVNDLSLPEHLLIPLLVCGALRLAWRRAPRQSTVIDRPLAVYVGIIILSAAGALREYAALGHSVWRLIGPPVTHHFSFTVLDFTNGPFLVMHYAFVAVEGAMWFVLLTGPAACGPSIRVLGKRARGTNGFGIRGEIGSQTVRAAPLRYALVLSALIVALVGVAQAQWHFQLVKFFEQVQPDLIRINSTLPDPNTLGSFLVLLLPLGVVVALERPRGRWLAAGWCVLVLYCLIRTVSRTAWVSLAVVACGATAVAGSWPAALGMQLPAAATRRVRRAFAALLAGAVLAVLVVSIGGVGRGIGYHEARSPVDMLAFTLNARRPLNELVPARLDHWHAAINIWRDFPFLGAGIGKYALLKSRYLPEARSSWMFFTEPHNYYLKILSELGVVGLGAFLVLLASIGVQARRAWEVTNTRGRRRVAAIVAGLVGFLLCSLAQDPLILREMQYVFWTMVALLVLEMRDSKTQHSGLSTDPSLE